MDCKSSGRKINCQFGEIEKDKDFEKSSNVGKKSLSTIIMRNAS